MTQYTTNFKRVSTLPCEILMLEKQKQPETRITINSRNGKSHKSRLEKGTPLALPLIDGKLS